VPLSRQICSHVPHVSVDQFKPAKPAKQSSDLRMNFSLWLIAVVIATINAVPLSEIEDQDYATELPNISDIVDMKIVTEEPLESDIESVTEVVVLDDETTVNSSSEEIITFDDLESIESPDPSIQVFQEVRKLWDLPNEGEFPSDEDNLEAQLKQEELELNEVANNLGDDDIVDVISNFIADKDPMLQMFLGICFIDPDCYSGTSPFINTYKEEDLNNDGWRNLTKFSSTTRVVIENLLTRRTEKARNILIKTLMNTQAKIKHLMFKYIEIGVGARGVSIIATKNIIDAVKNIWIRVDSDLEYAKTTLQRLFLTLDMTTKQNILSLAELEEIILAIPTKMEPVFLEATQDGYKEYIQHRSWNSWKRNPKFLKKF